MEIIKITWQRFVNGDGEVIDRCNKTYLNLEKAIFKLEPVLLNFGVKLCFEKKSLPYELINEYPDLNNTILIDDQPIEKFVEIKKDKCLNICGKFCQEDCEEIDEEVIPEHLIVTAILSRVKERALKLLY